MDSGVNVSTADHVWGELRRSVGVVFDGACAALFATDPSGTFTIYEGRRFPFLHAPRGRIVGGSAALVCEEAPWLLDALDRATKAGTEANAVQEVSSRWFACTCVPIRVENQAPGGVLGWLTELTCAKTAARALEAQHRFFRIIDVIAWCMDPATERMLDVDGATAGLGFAPEAWTAAPGFFASRLDPAEREQTMRLVRAVAADGRERSCLHRMISASGRPIWFRTRLRGVHDAAGRLVCVAGTMLDISERVGTERALRDNGEQTRLVLDQLPAIVFTTDRELRITSRTGRDVGPLGLGPSSVTGIPLMEFLQTDDPNHPYVVPVRRALQGETVEFEPEWMGRVYQTRVEPFRDREGNILGTLAVAWDVTRRKRAEEALRLLSDAGLVLAESLEYDETLPKVARLIVPAFAEWCVFGVADGDHFRLVASAHKDPRKEALLDELGRAEASPLDGLVRRRAPRELTRIERVTPDMLAPGGEVASLWDGPRAPELLRELGVASVVVAPLVAREHSLGVLMLARAPGVRPFCTEGAHVAEELARRCATAIDNSLLYRAAQRAIEGRDEFLSIASHELRTPLTSILLGVQNFERLMDDSAIDVPRVKKTAEIIVRQSKHLASLVEDLLDVSRIEVGRMSIAREELDLSELARDVATRFEPQASRSGARIAVHLGPPVVGRWDRMRLEQVTTNLLSNALKFAPHSVIEVAVEADDAAATLTVRDHGIGISRADVERIFDRFERAASARHYGGFGLGLYITRRIVEAHGGTIRVESTPGQGSTFEVRLPRIAA